MLTTQRAVILGLDCAEPSLVFGRFREKLPTLSRLADAGVWGKLRSCDPPITVPAWMVMISGKDPGTLGFTGFRNRADRSYDRLSIVTSQSVGEPLLWDRLGDVGKQSLVIGVPPTFPPRPIKGNLITGFLTPSLKSNCTYPPELKDEITQVAGDYLFDVPHFRTDDKERLKRDIWRMTETRFSLARHLLRSKPWDFFMMVEMGTDRIHHGFWKYMDPTHPKYVPGNEWESVIEDYYVFVDGQIAMMLNELPDDTDVLVVSDHGATSLAGGICVNEWLIQQGYLVLEEYPSKLSRFEELKVNWSKTRAWGEGGYYGRIFVNVESREPNGTIPTSEYEAFRRQLARELEAIPDPDGQPLGTRVLRPEDLYHQMNGIVPDLMAYFGNLSWRSVGTVGTRAIHTSENDTGPDDANHAFDGMIIMSGPRIAARGEQQGMRLIDVTPTLLELFGLDVPADIQGKVIPFD